ncbi:MAG: hypothetical protein WAV47_19505 [Blastocatellia bacterium]
MTRPGDTTQKIARATQDLNARNRRHAEMLVLMRGLARRYKSLVNRISKAELNATFIEYEMAQLMKLMEEYLDQSVEGLAGDQGASASAETDRGLVKPLRRLAESGTSLLEIKTRPDGLADIRIDGGKQFALPPTLADLLTALSIDNGPGDDAFVGWKTVKEVAEYLTRQSGKPVSKRAITQNVYRLRKELFDRGGVNPYLVQTNRRRGIRFALRRKPNPVIANDR